MTTASQEWSTEGYGPRLEILEHQLADLLKKSREVSTPHALMEFSAIRSTSERFLTEGVEC